jgi:hypothetical protein
MEPGYRDKLIMHAFYPKRVPFFNPTTLKIVLFYGALFELVEKRVLRIEDNRIICNATETGDKVLDTVIDLIAPLSGKKLSHLQMVVPRKAGMVYKVQTEQMVKRNYLTGEPVTFLFWSVGTRYQARRHEMLRPGIKSMESALVYGRKPDRECWLMIMLVAEAGLFRNIFPVREYRKKAGRRFRELLKTDFHTSDHSIPGLLQSLRRTLTSQKANRGPV